MWRHISDLPDENLSNIVFWNPCEGPHHLRYMLAVEARGYREDDVFSHFLILPEDTPAMRAEHERLMQARDE